MKMEDQQKEVDKEVTEHIKDYLPKAIFVLKDLVGVEHEHKKPGIQ